MPEPKKKKGPWGPPIRQLRKHFGWNQEKMAEALSVKQTAISRWEAGLQEPSRQSYEELYFLAGDLPCAKFFWDHAGLSAARVNYVLKGLKFEIEHPVPEIRHEPQPWMKLLPAETPVAIPLLKDAAAAGGPRIVEDQVDEVMFFASRFIPHPEMTRCVRVSGDSMSPVLEDGFIVAVDAFEKSPRANVNSMVVAMDPDGAVTVKWLRKIGKEYVLVPQHTSPRYNPVILTKEHGWNIVGRVLFWIGRPPQHEHASALTA